MNKWLNDHMIAEGIFEGWLIKKKCKPEIVLRLVKDTSAAKYAYRRSQDTSVTNRTKPRRNPANFA